MIKKKKTAGSRKDETKISLILKERGLDEDASLKAGEALISQGAKKSRSDSLGLVEFIVHLPDGQVKVFREIFL